MPSFSIAAAPPMPPPAPAAINNNTAAPPRPPLLAKRASSIARMKTTTPHASAVDALHSRILALRVDNGELLAAVKVAERERAELEQGEREMVAIKELERSVGELR